MVHLVVYPVLIALYLISFFLLRKYDASKNRNVFVTIWAIFLIALVLYPFFMPRWWKLMFFFSCFVAFAPMLLDCATAVVDENSQDWIPGRNC